MHGSLRQNILVVDPQGPMEIAEQVSQSAGGADVAAGGYLMLLSSAVQHVRDMYVSCDNLRGKDTDGGEWSGKAFHRSLS